MNVSWLARPHQHFTNSNTIIKIGRLSIRNIDSHEVIYEKEKGKMKKWIL